MPWPWVVDCDPAGDDEPCPDVDDPAVDVCPLPAGWPLDALPAGAPALAGLPVEPLAPPCCWVGNGDSGPPPWLEDCPPLLPWLEDWPPPLDPWLDDWPPPPDPWLDDWPPLLDP